MYTVITGLFDIGRGNWTNYRRPIEYYIHYFKNVLSLQAHMVIFCEEQFVKVVHTVRDTLPYSTIVITTSFEELYMYKYKDLLLAIQKDPNYSKDHPNKLCPEIAIPAYSLVTASKPALLLRGSKLAKTDYCIWLDGGYTHSTVDISKIKWNPKALYEVKDKMSMIKLRDMTDMISDNPKEFSDQYIDIINGGFFGGHKNTIQEVCTKYYEIVDEMLTVDRIKEDDQFYWTILAKRYPEMMNLIPGSWYSAFNIQ